MDRGRVKRGLFAGLPWVILFCWAAAAAFYQVANADIWVHLKVGTELLRTGQVPDTNTYSWVGQGRPFVAHEWLAGLVFQVIGGPTDGHGLTVLRSWLVSLVVVCCAIALPREYRSSALTMALAAVVMVIVVSRASVRPHLFSLVFAAMLTVGFSWWRELRRWRALLWAPPLMVLWANLHGAYLLAPALFAVLGCGVAAAALFPRLSPGDAERPWTLRDALQPFAVGGLCLLAALVNPYGTDLFQFSVQMGGGNDYIKVLISEWLSPFHEEHRDLLEPYLLLLYLAALWGGFLLRRRALSLPDVAIALATTFLAVRVIRFIPYLALFCLPIVAGLWAEILRDRVKAAALERWRRVEPWLALLIPSLLVVWLLERGPSFRMGGDRLDFAWGFFQAPAMAPVKHLHAIAYEGGVFNEYEDGGYLVYAGRDRFRPVIDARIDVFGPELSWEWVHARTHADAIVPYVDKHRVGAVLLRKERDNHEGHRAALLSTGKWRVEIDDDGYLLLLRSDALQRATSS